MIDFVVLGCVLLAASWLVAGAVTFILGLFDALGQPSGEPHATQGDLYETIHDGSNWIAGLFAAVILGPIGLFLCLREKVMNRKKTGRGA